MSRLYIIGEVDHDSYRKFSKQLAKLEKPPYRPIDVELVSFGGDAGVSLAFYSRIKSSKCDIRIHGSGYIYSAAVLILAAGDYRTMTKSSWLMVHEESDKLKGFVRDLKTEVEHLQRMEEQCYQLLCNSSAIHTEQWANYHKATTYFTANDCLALGIIDEVV